MQDAQSKTRAYRSINVGGCDGGDDVSDGIIFIHCLGDGGFAQGGSIGIPQDVDGHEGNVCTRWRASVRCNNSGLHTECSKRTLCNHLARRRGFPSTTLCHCLCPPGQHSLGPCHDMLAAFGKEDGKRGKMRVRWLSGNGCGEEEEGRGLWGK